MGEASKCETTQETPVKCITTAIVAKNETRYFIEVFGGHETGEISAPAHDPRHGLDGSKGKKGKKGDWFGKKLKKRSSFSFLGSGPEGDEVL